MLSEFVRTRWAASFSDSTDAQALLQKVHPPIFFETKTHLPFTILGAILLIIWVLHRQRWLLWCGGALLLEVILRTAVNIVNLRYYKSIDASLERFSESTNPNLSVYLAIVTVASSLVITWFLARRPWMLWLGVPLLVLTVFACLADWYWDIFMGGSDDRLNLDEFLINSGEVAGIVAGERAEDAADTEVGEGAIRLG